MVLTHVDLIEKLLHYNRTCSLFMTLGGLTNVVCFSYGALKRQNRVPMICIYCIYISVIIIGNTTFVFNTHDHSLTQPWGTFVLVAQLLEVNFVQSDPRLLSKRHESEYPVQRQG